MTTAPTNPPPAVSRKPEQNGRETRGKSSSAAGTSPAPEVEYLLRLGDDCLILSHRLAEWSAKAPQIEEDIALTNLGLDLLGQARALLTRAGEIEAAGRDEDDLAYLREEHDFRCCLLVEQPNAGDFALTMVRQLYFAAYQLPLLTALSHSTDVEVAGIAAKGVKEVRYHLEHAAGWVIRLGDGTEVSHRRAQAAVDAWWTHTGELFESDDVTRAVAASGFGVDPAGLRDEWLRIVTTVLDEATLTMPTTTPRPGTGRRGVHSEHLGYLLAEMQYLHRLHPGATW